MHGECEGKRAYRTRREARLALNDMRGRRRGETSPYNCKHCGKWHLTSLREPRSRGTTRLAPAHPWRWQGTTDEDE